MELIQTMLLALAQNAPYLIGFIMPPFVELLNKDIPANGKSKFIVTVLVSLLVAINLNWRSILFETDWNSVESTLGFFSMILAQSEVAYRLYFKGSNLQKQIVMKVSAQTEATK